VYIAALVVVTLVPIAWGGRPDDYRPQLVPFEGIRVEFQASPVGELDDLFGNVLLFAPLGFSPPAARPGDPPLVAGAGRRRGHLAAH
jgi:hypothetical protein